MLNWISGNGTMKNDLENELNEKKDFKKCSTTMGSSNLPLSYVVSHWQGAYKSGKMKFPEFSMFSRPSKQSFPDNYKVKTRCNKSP